MKLKEYAELIQKLANKYPNAAVVSASDEEGNSFSEVFYAPTPGKFSDGEFDDESKKPNAVCIN